MFIVSFPPLQGSVNCVVWILVHFPKISMFFVQIWPCLLNMLPAIILYKIHCYEPFTEQQFWKF